MRTVSLLGIASLVLFLAIAICLRPLKPGVVELQFTFSEPAFAAVIEKWQSSGVALFRSHLPADFALQVLYASFGLLLSGRWPKARLLGGSLHRVLRWSLPLAALADAAENVLHLQLTSDESGVSLFFYPLAGVAASVKWLGILAFAIVFAMCWHKRAG
jgi:hypothetical protein